VNVLALDCSGSQGSVAVVSRGETTFFKSFDCPRGRGAEVFEVLNAAISAGPQIQRIVVGTGPGSYNGLRVTAAAAEGIALAIGCERTGVLSLLGLDGGDDFWAAGDARGGTLYLARITGGNLVGEIAVLPRTDAIHRINAEGSGLRVLVPSVIEGLDNAEITHPDARRLAVRGAMEQSMDQISPYYAKPVHITSPSTIRPTLAAISDTVSRKQGDIIA
jgi:tRNA threonylcarbamoyl adenosine modification protein YeaZ